MLATFDAPTEHCAAPSSCARRWLAWDCSARAAIHTGVERRHDDVGGIGSIAARLGAAGPDQVVVTRTVRDLATGTDLQFVPLGTVSLRGVPGQWELFEASLS